MANRPELTILEETPHLVSVILDGDDNLVLHYSSGDASVFTKNPEGPRIIEYMASIAPHFGGVVTGDEGETFSSPADWGTPSDWDRVTISAEKPWWKRELSRGKRVALGLLLGVVAIVIKHLFFP